MRNWAGMQSPAIGTRAHIIRRAGDMQTRGKNGPLFLSGYKGSSHHHQPSELFSLLYAPQMTLVSAWINF